MSAITAGRRSRLGYVGVPRWRLESSDSHVIHIGAWLYSHEGRYLTEHVSRNEIARATGVGRSTVDRVLEQLEAENVIDVDRTGPRGKLTIVFHEADWMEPTGPQPSGRDTLTGREPSGDRTTAVRSDDSHLSTGEKKGERVVADATLSEADAAFEKFWTNYPNVQGRRRDKAKVRKKFLAIYASDRDELKAGAKAWFAHWRLPGNAQFVPAPATWFNQERWRADVVAGLASAPAAVEAEAAERKLRTGGDRLRWEDMDAETRERFAGVPGVDPNAGAA